ncbi:unnamed protein product [Rhizophagus irregularis]|nr:unnamed protein product [Rhizophagus irregularis]
MYMVTQVTYYAAERYNTQLRSQNANNIKFGGHDIESHSKKNETIGELKRRIKAEKDYFDTIGASDLRLWRTNTRIGSNNAIPCFDLSDSNEILSYFEIKDIWKEDPPKSNLHVVIKIEVVALNCIISGYPSDTYYPIEISVERNVGELKSMIKKRWKPLFSHIVSNELKLMAINIPPNQVITYEEDKSTRNNSNGRSPTQRTHDGNTQGEFIRSDSMLERIMWGKFYRIDNSYIYVQKIEPRNVRMINNFHEVFYFNIRILSVQETIALIQPKSLRKNRMHLQSEDINSES